MEESSEAIKKRSQKTIKEQVQRYSQIRGKYDTEDLMNTPYIIEINLRQARTMFRVRSSMFNAKMNQKSISKYTAELWKIV